VCVCAYVSLFLTLCVLVRLCEEGGDWDRRNRLKVYDGLYAMSVRSLPRAAKLLIDALPTFTCTEVRTRPIYACMCVSLSLSHTHTQCLCIFAYTSRSSCVFFQGRG
jgi:hypothetical protein